jgi:hypothetical protein
MQLCVGWHSQLIADGNISAKFRVVKVTDANVVATLLNRRISFDTPDFIFALAAEPVSHFYMATDLDLAGRARVYLNIA